MEEFGWVQEWWPQVIGIGVLVVVATRLREQVHELRKDVDLIMSRNTFVTLTKIQAQTEQQEKQISAIWQHTNKLRDRIDDKSSS